MKIIKLAFLFFLVLTFTENIYSQGYFVPGKGEYVPEEKFKTNIQTDLSKYTGTYTAVSETYESGYTYYITTRDNVLDILIVGSASMDGESWQQDSSFVKGVTVENGKFSINNNQIFYGGLGDMNFRFVKVSYKAEGKTINAEGLVMEEY